MYLDINHTIEKLYHLKTLTDWNWITGILTFKVELWMSLVHVDKQERTTETSKENRSQDNIISRTQTN